MLWYKSWLETRWRFAIGLALLACSAAAVVFGYPRVVALLPLVPDVHVGGEIGRRIRESAELVRTYPGYVWSQWFSQNLANTWTIFAAILGTGGLLSQSSSGAALFTLSMPVSRQRLLGVRAAAGLAELFVLAVVPSLLLALLSPAVGESYGIGQALVHSTCLFIGGSVFFSLTVLLSTVFGDIWRPLLIALSVAIVVSLLEQVFRDQLSSGIFHVMSAESYFRSGVLPWPGLLASVALSAGLLWGSAVNLERLDF